MFLTHYSIPLPFLNSLPLTKYNNKTQHFIYINSNVLISTHISRVQSFDSTKDYFNLYCKSYNKARSHIRTNWPRIWLNLNFNSFLLWKKTRKNGKMCCAYSLNLIQSFPIKQHSEFWKVKLNCPQSTPSIKGMPYKIVLNSFWENSD